MQLVHEHTVAAPAGLAAPALFAGLLDFIRRPELYVDALQGAKVEAREAPAGRGWTFERELDFGGFSVRDAVQALAPRTIITRVAAAAGIPPSRFVITLEPAGAALAARFAYYEDPAPGVSDNPGVMALRRRAWEAKDRDVMARVVSRLAAGEPVRA
ncbi:MAG: DUF1857 family protein [Duodenibacillus sp.]|nr:DUF1857 family protein [Duodenibacillus sp.]